MKPTRLFLFSLILLAACNEPPQASSGSAPVQDTLAVANAQFDETVFDTIQWPSDSAAVVRGAAVWKIGCAQCHGLEGRGDARFVNEKGDTLKPPSFVAADWELAQNPAGIRRKVYVGNTQGMPHWGLRRMALRDMDAVAQYIVLRLHTGNP
jgi:mono/diheme cytochrome c family protein